MSVNHKLLWLLTAALGFLAASDAFATGPYGAGPSRQWINGAISWTYHNNCISGTVETETGQYVGWVGNLDATSPRVGDVYYAHVIVGTTGNACASTYVHVEVVLPPSTQFEISAGHPVNCIGTSPSGAQINLIGCPQTVSVGTYGWAFDNTDPQNSGQWPLPQGYTMEIQFPLRSLQQMSGIATNTYLNSYVQAIDGVGNPWGTPSEGIFIGPKPPGSRLGQGGEDFDYDLRADVTVYHQASGLWYTKLSSTGTTYSVGYGGTGYTPVSGDFDWDGYPDVGVYHQNSGLWFIRKSSTGTTYSVGFGGPGFTPVPADYDWDQQTDFAVYHEASGLWYIATTTTGGTVGNQGFGGTGYAPVPKDYDGDGKTDLAVYHQASGLWFIKLSSTGAVTPPASAAPGSYPCPGTTMAMAKLISPSTIQRVATGTSGPRAGGPTSCRATAGRHLPQCPLTTTATERRTSRSITRPAGSGSSSSRRRQRPSRSPLAAPGLPPSTTEGMRSQRRLLALPGKSMSRGTPDFRCQAASGLNSTAG
jgi:hypothetical protein